MADRYPCPNLHDHAPGAEIELGAEIARHVAQVMRASPGEELVLFDGAGREADVTLLELGKRSLRVRIERQRECKRRPRRDLELAFSPPKGSRPEQLVELCTAFGVRALQPLHFERTPKSQRWDKIPARLPRIALAVAGQCGLDVLPRMAPPLRLEDYVRERLVSFEGQRWIAEPQQLRAAEPPRDDRAAALVVIGPEGDFTDAERGLLHEAGCCSLELGPFVLRTEAAAIAAAAQLLLGPRG